MATKTPDPQAPADGSTKTDDKPAGTPDAGKPDAGKPDAGKDGKPDAKAGDAAGQQTPPETYALTVPDNSMIDAADLKAAEALAKQLKWDNETAQGWVNAQAAGAAAQSQAFQDQTKADPDYGGDRLAETQQLANAIIDRVRPAGHPRAESFRTLLRRTGYGNNIEVISFLADLGKLTKEDAPGGRTAIPGEGAKAPEDVLYGPPKS
jgi:hypothetical protein